MYTEYFNGFGHLEFLEFFTITEFLLTKYKKVV